MSLTRIQRDAMTRAQNGDWELADAIEVIARAESPDAPGTLIGGIRRGGRLQMLAYRSHEYGEKFSAWVEGGIDCCGGVCGDEQCDCCVGLCDCAEDLGRLELITDLAGSVLYDRSLAEEPKWWEGVDITLAAAQATVAAYLTARATPIQPTLIPEPA